MTLIREFKSQDIDQLIDLIKLNTPKYFDVEEEKDFKLYLLNETEDYFVVELEDNIVGCGGINYGFNNGTLARISWDMIHPDFQGKGIGSLLVSHRLNVIKSKTEVKTVIVRTTQLVYPFYEKMGFTLKETKKDFWAKGIDLYLLEKFN